MRSPRAQSSRRRAGCRKRSSLWSRDLPRFVPPVGGGGGGDGTGVVPCGVGSDAEVVFSLVVLVVMSKSSSLLPRTLPLSLLLLRCCWICGCGCYCSCWCGGHLQSFSCLIPTPPQQRYNLPQYERPLQTGIHSTGLVNYLCGVTDDGLTSSTITASEARYCMSKEQQQSSQNKGDIPPSIPRLARAFASIVGPAAI